MKQELYHKVQYVLTMNFIGDMYEDPIVKKLLEEILEQESPEITWDDLDVGQWFRYSRSAPSSQYIKVRDDLCWRFSNHEMTDALFRNDIMDEGIVLIDKPCITDNMREMIDAAEWIQSSIPRR